MIKISKKIKINPSFPKINGRMNHGKLAKNKEIPQGIERKKNGLYLPNFVFDLSPKYPPMGKAIAPTSSPVPNNINAIAMLVKKSK